MLPPRHSLLALFDDLEQQAAGLALVERDAEVADLAEAEYAAVDLAARLHGSLGQEVVLGLREDRVRGVLDRVGADFVVVRADGVGLAVSLPAVVSVSGLGRTALPANARPLTARLGLRSLLRRLSKERLPLVFALGGAQRVEGEVDRVGSDFVELVGGTVLPVRAIDFVRIGR